MIVAYWTCPSFSTSIISPRSSWNAIGTFTTFISTPSYSEAQTQRPNYDTGTKSTNDPRCRDWNNELSSQVRVFPEVAHYLFGEIPGEQERIIRFMRLQYIV